MAKRIVFQTAFDSYTESEQIGEGGSGRVFHVKDSSGNSAAVKLIHKKLTGEKGRRFKNELSFCFRNQHENILAISDHGSVNIGGYDHPFYVMPLYNGTLRTLIDSSIPVDRVLPLFLQVLSGVEAAHMLKVIHRDIKPENILYDSSKDRLVVADFGVARFTEDELVTIVQTKTGTRLANFQYAAPEQRKKGGVVDARADIYALGLILSEMITGEVPQGTQFKKISSVANSVGYLDDIVDQMLRQAPGERPSSIQDIKRRFIARGNEFVTQQKLDALRNKVVPTSDITDPLVLNPVTAVGVDVRQGNLIFKLSSPVTPDWANVFRRITGVSYFPGQGPANFGISGDQASISIGYDNQAQQLVDMFKEYLVTTNRDYERFVRERQAEAERELREQLKRKVQAEEQRQQLLKQIKL